MDNIKQLLNSGLVFDEVMKIGKLHDLHIDQIGDLDVATRALCLGEIKKEDFTKNITDRLEISSDLANTIVGDINKNILLRIREFIREGGQPASALDHPLETPDEILKHIEDGGLELPAPEKPTVPEPQPVPEPVKPTPQPEPAPTTNLTEHLLNNTVASPHVEEQKVEKKYSVDPYREPIM